MQRDHSKNRGKIAAAQAFFEAGNIRHAMALAAEVLGQDTWNTDALDLMCQAHFKNYQSEVNSQIGRSWIGYVLRNGNGRSAELKAMIELAQSWIGHSPEDVKPYRWLMKAYRGQYKRRKAKAVMTAFKTANPHSAFLIDLLQADFVHHYGVSATSNEWWASVYERRGEVAKAKTLRCEALMEQGYIKAAQKEIEQDVEDGVASENAIVQLATIYLRQLKLIKCREVARQIATQFPGNPISRELQILCWMTLFPPFLCGNIVMRLWEIPQELVRHQASWLRFPFRVICNCFAMGLLIAVVFAFVAAAHWFGLGRQATGLCISGLGVSTLLFAIYFQTPGLFSTLSVMARTRPVKIQDY